VAKWTVKDVKVWAKSIGLPKACYKQLKEKHVNGQVLLQVNQASFLSLFNRKLDAAVVQVFGQKLNELRQVTPC
jgi:hypothetical protein